MLITQEDGARLVVHDERKMKRKKKKKTLQFE